MTYATATSGSTGYAKPSKTAKGVAGKNNNGMRQNFKQTGEVAGLKASGCPNNADRAPVAPTGGRRMHVGNPY